MHPLSLMFTPHSSRSAGPTHVNDALSLSVLSILLPPQDSDKPTSSGNLLLPNDTSESWDLEQDLEQALADNDDHTALKKLLRPIVPQTLVNF